ncbi:hypothetical protein ISN45_Aa01g024860 [Arabidopsis thaliana x Arabidopsis arenosa]|uniref:Uncharacterized protein n=1 Tax=Arabidopsis thaliana x Arabidopsis arenosa TaxID=1240361 RepID=A0A8T2CEL4_9BRAS|nr:hypothetical protein ISN45_Aa01g024860 [Arabidopsis thaliana x Arabidopsis arenosa]
MGIEGEMSNGGLSIDEKEGLIDKDEVLLRRMKNRERQRRYRARKRMREEEAGIDENLSFETMGKQEEEEGLEFSGPSGYVENFVRRVYCDRDWKKEARRAHLFMNKAQDGSCESVKWKIRRHGRDWKAEARKKKS